MVLGQGIHQDLQQKQNLMMLPHMQQALTVLQASTLDLEDIIKGEIEENPLLDEVESVGDLPEKYGHYHRNQTIYNDDYNISDNVSSGSVSLRETLLAQAREALPDDMDVANILIDSLDSHGLLGDSLEELSLWYGVEIERLTYTHMVLQSFEPSGIAALDLRNSLLNQLCRQGMKGTVSYKIIDKYYQELLHNRIPEIGRALKLPPMVVQKNIEVISRLNLNPASGFDEVCCQALFVDAAIEEKEGAFQVEIFNDSLPEFSVNQNYIDMLYDSHLEMGFKDYIVKKLSSAKWLYRNIMQRQAILEGVLGYVAKYQVNFFSTSKGSLRPMMMRDVAEALEVHESTITRAVANKYIHTPRGLFPLRYFFDSGYGAEEKRRTSSGMKDLILELLKYEDKSKPLSDGLISKALKKKGVLCARRTIAKYRSQMKIASASQRRRY